MAPLCHGPGMTSDCWGTRQRSGQTPHLLLAPCWYPHTQRARHRLFPSAQRANPRDFGQIRSISSSWAGVTTLTLQVQVLLLLSRPQRSCYRTALAPSAAGLSLNPRPAVRMRGRSRQLWASAPKSLPVCAKAEGAAPLPAPAQGYGVCVRLLEIRAGFAGGKLPFFLGRRLRDVLHRSLPFPASLASDTCWIPLPHYLLALALAGVCCR